MEDIVYAPTSVNLELTKWCPLNCLFCYCKSDSTEHMELSMAKYWLEQAGLMGVHTVSLSGGETAGYPHLEEVIRYAKEKCGYVSAAFSGYGLTHEKIQSLQRAGLDAFHISLNGSTEKVNHASRNGFQYAMRTLENLKKAGIKNFTINYVLTKENADDFQNIVALAESYNAEGISILALKPDSQKKLKSRPSASQVYSIADQVAAYYGKLYISVESCYSELVSLIYRRRLINWMYTESTMGCRAGRYTFSVSVDGRLMPCRHLLMYEDADNLADYWYHSPILRQIRELDRMHNSRCANCLNGDLCRPCIGVRKDIMGSWDAPQPCNLFRSRIEEKKDEH